MTGEAAAGLGGAALCEATLIEAKRGGAALGAAGLGEVSGALQGGPGGARRASA